MLIPSSKLIRPTDYFVRAFDTNPHDRVNVFHQYTIQFECGACDDEIESDPLMIKGERVEPAIQLKEIDRQGFFARCVRLSSDRQLGTPFTMERACASRGQNHLILFGATEWQPGRDVIELGGIFLY